MNISIIIPTYNRGKYLGLTIQSFLEMNYPKSKFEIIIANNNSTDNTAEVVEKFKKNPQGINLHYIFEPRQGVHYARNSAAKIANFELLYFTDDDMIADKELLNEILKPFQFDDKVTVATGKVLPKWVDNPPEWILKHCNNYLLSLHDPEYDFLISDTIDFLFSCHLAIKRDVFFKVEGFNPEYTKGKYMGDGESGLNLKVKKLGLRFGYNSKSVIYHMIPASRFTQDYLNKRFENNGRAHAYTAFREKSTNFYLVLRIIKNLFYRLPFDIFSSVVNPIIKSDFSLYRFLVGKVYYWSGNFKFNFSLLTNSRLQSFVLKKDWLSNDSEFDLLNI